MRVRVQDTNIPMDGELSWFRAGQRDRVAQMIRGVGVVARATAAVVAAHAAAAAPATPARAADSEDVVSPAAAAPVPF